jgi:hypothetical protein
MLSRFGFEFARCREIRYEGKVNYNAVFVFFPFHLAHGFYVGERFYIAYGASYFGNYKIEVRLGSENLNAAFYFVGNVRNDLNGFPQVFATAFFFNYTLIDAASSNVIGLRSGYVQEALVVTKIEVGLGTIVGNETLAVFIGVQCTWVYIDVGIQFLDGYSMPARLKQFC